MRLSELVQTLDPARTALLLGAGASIPSGAPSGAALARTLAKKVTPPLEGDDLSEISGIIEDRLGRQELASAVRNILKPLEPARGILALPAYAWRAVYSTNFDRLVEKSYRIARTELNVVRSNFDYQNAANNESNVTLFKIHGCISQDIGFGDRARMVLTEIDYDEVKAYREVLFGSLRQQMMQGTTLIVGQSLQDAHLRNLAKEIAELRHEGVPGRVYLLVYEYNEDRARLLERRGIEVVAGSLDNLMIELEKVKPASSSSTSVEVHSAESPDNLPRKLAPVTDSVGHAIGLRANVTRLFNGGPATYADIHNGLTIERQHEPQLLESQRGARGFFLVLSGAAGVGKTSLARRLLYKRFNENFLCWEHLNDYPLDVDAWLGVEATLRSANRQGILLIDDCARHLTTVNKLVDGLGKLRRPFLRLIVTVNASQWSTRPKSQYFFSRGTLEKLSRLTDNDIRSLVDLVNRNAEIRALVENDFLRLGHQDKIRRLRERCSADMFVCLKNIFQTENLDTILLQEFSDLDDDAQDVYRYVCVVQAMGGKVHRQLIMRLLGLEAGALANLLGRMEEVVTEYDISVKRGLYGWTARHDVIAQVITRIKFADQQEIFDLFEKLIDGLNPTEYLELETARSMAADDMGIPRLSDRERRATLLKRLIRCVPGERIPRRRLIRMYLEEGQLDLADREIRLSQEEIGNDTIVDRYRATWMYQRAETTSGFMDEDRKAMLLEAARLARECVEKTPNDRYNYRVLGDIARSLAERFGRFDILDETIATMIAREADIADPDFARDRRGLESTRRRIEIEAGAEIGANADNGEDA